MRKLGLSPIFPGFGLASSHRFAAEGWQLIITGRRAERLQALGDEFPDTPMYQVVLDIRDRRQIEAMVADLPDQFKNIDVLFNNAGLPELRPVCYSPG